MKLRSHRNSAVATTSLITTTISGAAETASNTKVGATNSGASGGGGSSSCLLTCRPAPEALATTATAAVTGVSGSADVKTATANGGSSQASASVAVASHNTSSTQISDAAGIISSTWSDPDGCQWKSHFPPFTDSEVKTIAAMFEKTINAHTYGYAPITNITHIVTFTNPKLDAEYRKKANAIKQTNCDPNEVLAFHGWYGSGVYLTQHAGAALRYQYWNTSVPPNRMLCCRVLLGRVFTVPENSCEFIGKGLCAGYDSHRGRDRWDAEWQICTFDTASILPAAHIYYK